MNRTMKAVYAAVLAAMAGSATAVPMDFSGYFRSGGGTSSKGGKEVCFRLPGAEIGFFRLGNECDTYASLNFGANLGEVDGTGFKAVFTMAYGTQQLANWEQSTPAWRQAYVEASDIGASLNAPALKGASLWAGKRFYKNPDIHMLDYTYWEPAQGPGGGIDGMDIGFGKFSYAMFRIGDFEGYGAAGGFNPGIVNGGDQTATVHDFRVSDVLVNPGGALTVGLDLIRKSNHSGAAGSNGYGLTVSHTQNNLFGLPGSNNAVLQVARNAASLKGFGFAGSTAKRNEWLLFDHWTIDSKDLPISAALVAGIHHKEVEGVTTKMFFAGARPQYHFNNVLSIASELGYQQLKEEGGPTRRLTKFTIAPQFSMGRSLWARPALRLYYTYAKWNGAARDAGNVVCTGRDCGTPVDAFSNSTSGGSYGVQVEAWF